jgi:hypothetical protein
MLTFSTLFHTSLQNDFCRRILLRKCIKPLPEATTNDTHRQMNTTEQAAQTWTDNDMVKLMITVQQIMMV